MRGAAQSQGEEGPPGRQRPGVGPSVSRWRCLRGTLWWPVGPCSFLTDHGRVKGAVVCLDRLPLCSASGVGDTVPAGARLSALRRPVLFGQARMAFARAASEGSLRPSSMVFARAASGGEVSALALRVPFNRAPWRWPERLAELDGVNQSGNQARMA